MFAPIAARRPHASFLRRLTVLLTFFMPSVVCAAGLEALDDTGQRVSLPAPAERIVSLAPHATELLYSIGAGKRIVATVEHSDFPPEAQALPRVGGATGIDLERLLVLRPDLVVGWASGNPPRLVERLRGLGVPVYLTEPRRLTDIASNLERLGALTGQRQAARAAAEAFTVQYQALAARYAGRPRLRVFHQVLDPLVITVNDQHLISEIGRLCGGENVFAGAGKLDPIVSEEAVLAADPEIIVASGTEEAWGSWEPRWRSRKDLTAARRGNLYFIPADFLHRQSPRVLEGARRMCAALDEARLRP